MDNEKKQFDMSFDDGGLKITPRSERQPKQSVTHVWYYLGTFGNIGFSIALPIIIGTLSGVWIDSSLGSRPTATLAGIIIGLIISIFGFLRMIQKILRGDYNP